MNRIRAVAGLAVAAVLSASALGACTSSSANDEPSAGSSAGAADTDAPVTITVGEKPPADQKDLLDAFTSAVDQFEAMYPNITVNAEETTWSPETYQAMIAGGTLPTTLRVPLTEIQGLASRGQVLDLTDLVAADPVASKVNPALYQGTTRDDRVYGVPVGSYTVGLIYNRALYAQAGLDPDVPPATWDEVRANAKAIQEATGAAGFVIPTTDNAGGWMLSAMSYSMGGTLEDEAGETATIDSEPVKQALELLRTIRWEDGTFGSNFLLKADDAQREIAAGNVGQAVLASDRYNALVVNFDMSPDDVGIGPLPQDTDGIGTLAGGNISVVRPDATPEEAAAALKWVDFYYLNKWVDEDAAVADAESRKEAGLPNGSPVVPIFDNETNDQYLEYIKDYVDVPREHFTALFDSFDTLAFVPEPRNQAQQIYSLLDATVQAALTEEGASVDDLVATANSQAQDLIAAG